MDESFVETSTRWGQNDDSIKLFASGMVVSDVIVWNLNNGAAFQLAAGGANTISAIFWSSA